MYRLIPEVILPNIFYICGILAEMTYFHYNVLRILHYTSALAKIKLWNLLFQNESCKKLIVLHYFKKIWLSYSKSRLLINLQKKAFCFFIGIILLITAILIQTIMYISFFNLGRLCLKLNSVNVPRRTLLNLLRKILIYALCHSTTVIFLSPIRQNGMLHLMMQSVSDSFLSYQLRKKGVFSQGHLQI